MNILKTLNNLILISLLYIHPEKGPSEVQINWALTGSVLSSLYARCVATQQ